MTTQPTRIRIDINENSKSLLASLVDRYQINPQCIVEIALLFLLRKSSATDAKFGRKDWLIDALYDSDMSFAEIVVENYLR